MSLIKSKANQLSVLRSAYTGLLQNDARKCPCTLIHVLTTIDHLKQILVFLHLRKYDRSHSIPDLFRIFLQHVKKWNNGPAYDFVTSLPTFYRRL